MLSLDTLKKHISYQSADQIAKICSPLFENFSINYFCYSRLYHNSVLTLVSNKNWLEYYVKNKHLLALPPSDGTYTWDTEMPYSAVKDGAVHFNLHNGIGLKKSCVGFTEIINFASPNHNNNSLEFCNQKDLLNQFLFYFKDKANELIKKMSKDLLSLPREMAKPNSPKQSYADFQAAIKAKQLYIIFNNDEVTFSEREFEVLSLIAAGHTMKHAAEILHISHRTVETHINNVKNKTCDISTLQLIEQFKENFF